MSANIYYWRMSALAHKESIRALKRDILAAHNEQLPFPISLILDLLPLQTNQMEEISSRGDFIFHDNEFINESQDDLWVEFYDPVMEEFSATLPPIWKGLIKIDSGILTILFEDSLELEVPRIAALGIDRSMYQQLESIQVSNSIAISKLKDATSEEKEVWIQVEFDQLQNSDSDELILDQIKANTEFFSEEYFNPILDMANEENTIPCPPPDESDPDWYVYQKQNVCLVHHKVMHSPAYQQVFGPDTKQACKDWVRDNPDCI